MSLIADVKQVMLDLMEDQHSEETGWASLLELHGWPFGVQAIRNMGEADFAEKLLNHELAIDHDVLGFEDFAADGNRMISPGKPSRSLLYHALACPNVVEHRDNTELTVFPTLGQIDKVENYVFASRKSTLANALIEARELLGLSPQDELSLSVAVFAFEYRPASETPHRTHADLCLARTGISRVGTKAEKYVPRKRGFVVFDAETEDVREIRVLPCRYSVYLAVKSLGKQDRFGPVNSGSEANEDAQLEFWVPIHKLFNGAECLVGIDLEVDIDARHFNQKIEKMVRRLRDKGFSNVSNDDLEKPDFRFEGGIADLLDATQELGPGVLRPIPQALVQPAQFNGSPLSFQVPPMTGNGFGDTFSPSLSLDAETSPPVRSWPEYAHVRQRTDVDPPVDINLRADVVDFATAGDFKAQHYKDFAGDGWVTPTVKQKDTGQQLESDGVAIQSVSAFSLVTAPDFYPNVNQRQVYEWWRAASVAGQNPNSDMPDWWRQLVVGGTWGQFWRREPEPLSDERYRADVQLPESPFDDDDRTVTGIVTLLQAIDLNQSRPEVPPSRRHSYLPDSAAGAFAPGWDASVDNFNHDGGTERHFAAYGLGSPFPEDAKLCAALSTFWPAAAPDTARTFFTVPFANGTVCPLTDDEVGVAGNGVPWDGVPGPHIVSAGAQTRVVDYPDYPHADYTRNSINELFSIAKTSKVTLSEYQLRILAMLRCYSALQSQGNRQTIHVLSFRAVEPGDAELTEAQLARNTTLAGPVFRFDIFTDTVTFSGGQVADNVSAPEMRENNHRARYTVDISWVVFVGTGRFVLLRWKRGDGSAQRGSWIRRDV
jgi:hypothetical protein